MLKKLKQVLASPFKWGFEAIDTRPTGATIRRTARQLHAVEGGEHAGIIQLVVGKGKVTNMPVVATITAKTPAEAVNQTLQFVSTLRRSKAGAINRTVRAIDKEVALAAKAARAAADAERKASGNEAGALSGTMTPSTAEPGSARGEGLLVPAGAA